MDRINSFITKIKIQTERAFDHAYRKITGLPTMKRSMITPQIFLGGQYSMRGFAKLKQMGVTGIVNMRSHSIHPDSKIENFNYLHLPTPDLNPPTIEDLNRGVEFIQKEIDNKGKVYIHCLYGEGRGPSMLIAYLMSTGMNYDDAHQTIKNVRKFINLTFSQIDRLKEYEKYIQSKTK